MEEGGAKVEWSGRTQWAKPHHFIFYGQAACKSGGLWSPLDN